MKYILKYYKTSKDANIESKDESKKKEKALAARSLSRAVKQWLISTAYDSCKVSCIKHLKAFLV